MTENYISLSIIAWAAVGLAVLLGTFYILRRLPQSLTRFIIGCIVTTRYRIKVHGILNIPKQGGVLLMGNHLSWIDWAVIQISCPRQVRFVLPSTIFERWHLNWFFKLNAYIPLQAGLANRNTLNAIAWALNNGQVVCLFPEGVISRNGHMGEFQNSYELVCAEVDNKVVVIPFYLRGLWGSIFSGSSHRLNNHNRTLLRREVVVDFGLPLSTKINTQALKQKVQELSMHSWYKYADHLPTLGDQWITTCARLRNPIVLLDTFGARLSAKTALTASIVMARRIRKLSPEPHIGLLLPSSTGSALANMACALLGKIAVNLNFTSSSSALLSAIKNADIKTIYTSSRFLEKLQTRGFDLEILQQQYTLVMLEDFRANTSALEKIATLLSCFLLPSFALKFLYSTKHSNEQTAVILFSSGSEGEPKGVQLSHKNIMTNIKQLVDLLNFAKGDVMLGNLPPFHAFGLTATHFLPLLEQIPVVCHADPTDVYACAMAIAEHRISFLFGTSSFFRLYNRNSKIQPLMLETIRLVVAGAEKLQEEVRTQFKLKFNKDIFEGYGATETAPVASVNIPDRISPDNWQVQTGWKIGSVGLPLPGTNFRIVDPETFAPLPLGSAGMILIGGAQVMTGYFDNPAKTAAALHLIDGKRWYVTGDKGSLDKDGFLFIEDRYSRFAKISGEMVGLGTVETALTNAVNDPDMEVVVVNVPDARKGEKLIALMTRESNTIVLRELLLANGLNTLALPAHYFLVAAIPKLGSGKTDFAGAKKLALELLE